VHDLPDPEKLKEFSVFLKKFGYSIKIDTPDSISESINKLLKEIKGTPEENILNTLCIKSMAKAYYTTKNIGHFGLAFDTYSHFTSPIRRFPDMLTHRILEYCLVDKQSYKEDVLDKYCKHVSNVEKNAVQAERDSIKFKQIEFLQDKIGMEFEGIISGVTDWGIYVELIENKCEGMVRISDMDGAYYFDQKSYSVVSRNTKDKYQLGDKIKVIVSKTDVMRKQLDFSIA